MRQAGWSLTLYPTAGEASGLWRSADGSRGGWSGGSRPDRSAGEAARRARGQVRRFCAANRLNRLGTLTYAGEGLHDPLQLRRDLAAFFRALRTGVGEPLPYLWVPEWHPGGHGLHAHFGVGRFVPRGLIDWSWGHGHVHIKLLSNLSAGSGDLAEARRAALYLAKYASKNTGDERVPGLHRYEVAQGFQPEKVRLTARTEAEVLGEASGLMGGPPAYVWRSSSDPGWDAPPACWAAWDA